MYRERPPEYGFGGPYKQSSTPWEDFQRDRRYRKQRYGYANRAQQPLVNLTLFFGAVAWVVIYGSFALIWDHNEGVKRDYRNFRARNYEDYLEYKTRLNLETERRNKSRESAKVEVANDFSIN